MKGEPNGGANSSGISVDTADNAISIQSAEVNVSAQAAASDTVKVKGTDDYAAARGVLAIVNKERKAAGLTELVFDPVLTKCAMQRSAELAIYYSHTRPNGTSCFTVLPSGSYTSAGENIAVGYRTAESVMDGWFYEERTLYKKYLNGDKSISEHEYGHYLNIMDPNFKSIGIGCFKQGDTYYWEQVFSNKVNSGTAPSAATTATHSIDVNYNTCTAAHKFNVYDSTGMGSLKAGNSFTMKYYMKNSGWGYSYAEIDPSVITWKSSNPSVCTVDANGVVKGIASGNATVTATLKSGKGLSQSWAVTGGSSSGGSSGSSNTSINIASASISVAGTTYTGYALAPAVTVKLSGKTLKLGSDYKVSY